MTYLDKAPEPLVGYEKYLDWINSNNSLRYLSDTITALDRVFIEFFVDTTGQIIHVKKLRGIGEPYDTEAIQLIQEHPHNCWAPATQSGRKLKTRFVIPISFL